MGKEASGVNGERRSTNKKIIVNTEKGSLCGGGEWGEGSGVKEAG